MVTFLSNKKHMIGGKVPMHNHAPEANCLIMEITIENINDKVRLAQEKPSKIIQEIHCAIQIIPRPYTRLQ